MVFLGHHFRSLKQSPVGQSLIYLSKQENASGSICSNIGQTIPSNDCGSMLSVASLHYEMAGYGDVVNGACLQHLMRQGGCCGKTALREHHSRLSKLPWLALKMFHWKKTTWNVEKAIPMRSTRDCDVWGLCGCAGNWKDFGCCAKSEQQSKGPKDVF